MRNMLTLLRDAEQNGYAVGSFSPRNTVLIETVLKAAADNRSPVIVQISANEFNWFSITPEEFAAKFRAVSGSYDVPVTLHLDHTKELSIIAKAIDAGFDSVMIDASHHGFEENIRITREVVEYAHAKGICVEAELGRIGATDKIETENDETLYTDPGEAEEFITRTGADTLAVSIGSAHGVYPVKNPMIDFVRLGEIRNRLSCPLVLHGGSGLPYDTIHKAIQNGISKVNIATDLEQAFLPAVGLTARAPNADICALPQHVLAKGCEAVYKVVAEKITDFVKSNNR